MAGLVGGWRGLRAVLGLAIALVVLWVYLLPALITGQPAMAASLAASVAIMVVVGALLGLLGFLKVRRIRGPRETIESVRETRTALTSGHDRGHDGGGAEPRGRHEKPHGSAPADTSGW